MTEKKINKKFSFQTEIVNGVCGSCNLNTLLVGIDNTFFRCISCGRDLEQKVNGEIKYIKVDKHTDLAQHGKN
jgi:tRNA(Ile2) C34 agmatinyltransferase TiaS